MCKTQVRTKIQEERVLSHNLFYLDFFSFKWKVVNIFWQQIFSSNKILIDQFKIFKKNFKTH